MPDLSTIREQVQDRLKELERLIGPLRAELEELKGVAEQFTSNGAATPAAAVKPRRQASAGKAAARVKPSASPRRARRSRGGGASRAAQAIGLIAEHPGMTVPEMAKAMGIGSNYLYRVLPALEKDGKVNKRGKGYHPVDTPAQAAAPEQG